MSPTLLLLVVLALSGVLIYSGSELIKIQRKNDKLREELLRYESLSSLEEEKIKLYSNIADLESKREFLNTQIRELQQKSGELEAKAYLQAIDSYEPKYDFINSVDYINRLQNIKRQQERMRKNEQAFICNTQWKVRESEREGTKMIKDLLKLVEFSFETQCKYNTKEVRYNNVDSLKKKTNTTFKKINNFLKKIDCRISVEYLELKLIELDLHYELEEKIQQEKEREKVIRDQIRQEEKERRQLEKARREAEEAEEIEKQYEEDIDKLRREMEQAVGLQLDDYNRQIKHLQEQLGKAQINKEKAISTFTRLKSGYIYVISNIGSLGRDVYRIFMTKNSNPDAYIRTMNPIVPFQFDVQFKIFSEDASETVQHLHQEFNDKRVNTDNQRREFFKVSFDEIDQFVQKIYRETGALTIEKREKVPQALEYRRTRAAERRKDNHTNLNNVYAQEGQMAQE